jgi:hypothetical protein
MEFTLSQETKEQNIGSIEGFHRKVGQLHSQKKICVGIGSILGYCRNVSDIKEIAVNSIHDTWNSSGTLGMVLTGGRGGGREGTRVSLSPGLRGMDGGAGACPLFGLPLLD